MNTGKLTQIIGSVFDAEFAPEHVPAVYNALYIEGQFGSSKAKLYGEV